MLFSFHQEKERKARRRGKALQNEETSATFVAEEEMEGSGASCNEEEAPEDGEGMGTLIHVPDIKTFFHSLILFVFTF